MKKDFTAKTNLQSLTILFDISPMNKVRKLQIAQKKHLEVIFPDLKKFFSFPCGIVVTVHSIPNGQKISINYFLL